MIVGGIRAPDTMAIYINMGAARCYFTGNDTAFLLDGAARQSAAIHALDAIFDQPITGEKI